MTAVEPGIRDLAREANFAAFTVLLRSGQPMTHVMWVDADDDHVLINTEVHRAKYEAVRRDPRVTVTIWKRDDPYRFAEVRGRVVETVTGQEAREHIDALLRK
jgi:PPOX class probable F420-dependent enzyme